MFISNRIMQTPHSPIRKLYSYSEKARERGIVVHNLNIG